MEVILNVYNLHDSNSALHSVGLGFYHTGVEVGTYEYSFSEAGISRTRPRLPEFGDLREQISLGLFQGELNELTNIIQALGAPGCQFAPGRYNLTTLNCNHFSDNLCMILVDKHIPEWINRMAGIGAGLVPPNKNPKKEIDDNGGFAPLGKVSDPTEIPTEKDNNKASDASANQSTNNNWSIFNWFGGSSTETTSTTNTKVKSNNNNNVPKTQVSNSKSKGNTKESGGKKELTDKQREMLNNIKKH